MKRLMVMGVDFTVAVDCELQRLTLPTACQQTRRPWRRSKNQHRPRLQTATCIPADFARLAAHPDLHSMMLKIYHGQFTEAFSNRFTLRCDEGSVSAPPQTLFGTSRRHAARGFRFALSRSASACDMLAKDNPDEIASMRRIGARAVRLVSCGLSCTVEHDSDRILHRELPAAHGAARSWLCEGWLQGALPLRVSGCKDGCHCSRPLQSAIPLTLSIHGWIDPGHGYCMHL